MFLRMADSEHNNVDMEASQSFSMRRPKKDELRDDITWWQHALEKKEQQLEVIRKELAARKEALVELESPNAHPSRQSTQSTFLSPSSTTTANKIPDSSQNNNESVRRSRRLHLKKRSLGCVSPSENNVDSPSRIIHNDCSLAGQHGNRQRKKKCT